MAIRHKRRTTRTELERVFCLPLDLFSLTFTIILGPLGWGAIFPMPPPPLWIRHCQEFDGGLRKDEDREFILTRVSAIISFIVTSLLVHTLILLWTLESGRKLMYAKSSWCGANVPIVLHVFGN